VRSRAKPCWAKNEIIRLKAHLPDAGCRQLTDTFNRLHAEQSVSVGKTWVSQVLKKHHHDILRMRRQLKHRVPRPQPRNLTWGLDLTGKGDAGGEQHAILGLVDHGSRRALALTALPRKNSLTLLGHLLIAIGAYGKPRSIRTDNEAVFTSRTFQHGLKLLGIRHQRSDPGCPWQNGRIERFFGTVKNVLDRLTVANAETLQHTLSLIGFWYNDIRPHQNLGGCTPLEAWQGIDPYSQPIK
jgi:transposase InsO family protein